MPCWIGRSFGTVGFQSRDRPSLNARIVNRSGRSPEAINSVIARTLDKLIYNLFRKINVGFKK